MASQPKRALLVIDVQNEYITGSLRIEYPDTRLSLTNIARAIDAANAQDIPVVLIQHVTPEGAPVFGPGSTGGALHPTVLARPYSHLVEKRQASAFTDTDLAAWLQQHSVDTITVAGYMTHNCDDATIKYASHLGLNIEFLVDASGSLPYRNRAGYASAEEIHRVFAIVLQSNFAAVVSTTEWVDALQSGMPLVRDNVFSSYQNTRASE